MTFRYQASDAETIENLRAEFLERYQQIEATFYGAAEWQEFIEQTFEIVREYWDRFVELEQGEQLDEDALLKREELHVQLLALRSALDNFLATTQEIRAERGRQARRTTPPRTPTPCLFISHRSSDWREAERVACIAMQQSYDYWLDIHDPNLAVLNRHPGIFPATLRSVLIAATIEMGLINSTHVIALWTTRSKGSMWIPYEYGRAKDCPALKGCPLWTPTAAMWIEDGIDPPEYALLARTLRTESALKTWLKGQQRPNDCEQATRQYALNGG